MKIGNASGFWGDRPGSGKRLLEQVPDLDFITYDYLAEVSMGILSAQQQKDPERGYAADFISEAASLPIGPQLKVVSNAGGLNPYALAKQCRAHLPNTKIAVVTSTNVNAYVGAEAIFSALTQGAELVITGRVADPSLVVGPARFHFGWESADQLAQATVAGHLLECGCQVTGGIATHWLDLPSVDQIPFPLVEFKENGKFIITKPAGTGGEVSLRTVKEQLLYEIGDPSAYLSPDVSVSFLNIALNEEGPDRIEVSGAKGSAPPKSYKVGAAEQVGFRAEATLYIFGKDSREKAFKCGDVILSHVEQQGFQLARTKIEVFGEAVLRIAVSDTRKEAVDCFAKEVAPMVTCGPPGVTGYTSGRPKIRPHFVFRPTYVPVEEIKTSWEFVA